MDEMHGGQWAILPAMVRRDKSIPANAKLIYAEIAAKVNEEGYCFCHNRYFSELLGLTEDSISGLIKKLEKAEYIFLDIDSQRVNRDRRRIYLTAKPYDFVGGIGNKSETRIGNKSETVSEKFPGPIENNNIKINPPISPKGGEGESGKKRRRAPKGVPDWEPEMFERFWKAYPRGQDRQGAVEAWDKLRPSRELMLTMSAALDRQKKSEEWLRGVGVPYACRWLRNRRWEDEDKGESGPQQTIVDTGRSDLPCLM